MQAQKVITLLRGLVEFYGERPGLIPDVADGSRAFPTSGSSDSLFESVRYVSGMTDRFAIAQAIALLDYPLDQLPRGV
jgi:hypothetical protein